MTSNDRFPQDWPKHLSQMAVTSSVETAPSYGQAQLDFTSMDSTTFEQFCWWLLKKDHTLVGCARLGGIGTAQEGIDLLAFDSLVDNRLHVFECKAWKKFGATELTAAVDAFLTGEWAESAERFTLILAQRDAGSALIKRWTKEVQKLKRSGIDGDLWTADHLTLRVQNYPDILTKFFPFHSVEKFANLWMERVAFYELVSKSFFDPREKVVQWAREIMGDHDSHDEAGTQLDQPVTSSVARHSVASLIEVAGESARSLPFIDGVYRKVTQFGDSWHFKGPWFHFSAILPSVRFTHASAAITFNRPDMQGVVLTVDHAWMLNRFLFKTGAPLGSQSQEIVLGEAPNERGQFVLDLPHCRLSLEEAGVRDLLEVADLLTVAVREALQRLELAWSAQNFPFLMRGGRQVALVTIPKRLWYAIGQFVVAHDVSKGDTRWHMFDGNTEVLKPYHQSATTDFDEGYHGIFYPANIEELSYTDEVVLLWQHDGLHPEQECSPRGWWSCDFAVAWINDALLPEVRRWVHQQRFGTVWSRIFKSRQAHEYSLYLVDLFVMRDLRVPPLLLDGRLQRSVTESVQELQSFFYSQSSERCFLRTAEVEALYRAVALAAKTGNGYVGYLQSKLALPASVTDHADLIAKIHQYVSCGRVHATSAVVDGALRALLEILKDSDAHLDEPDWRTIADSLVPFAKLLDEAMFVRRHTKWS